MTYVTIFLFAFVLGHWLGFERMRGKALRIVNFRSNSQSEMEAICLNAAEIHNFTD